MAGRRRTDGALVKSVRATLKSLGGTESAEAQLALSLARWLEDPETRDSARASMAGRLAELLAVLRAGGPVVEETPLERIRRERDAGVARLADAPDRARTRRRRAS